LRDEWIVGFLDEWIEGKAVFFRFDDILPAKWVGKEEPHPLD
jgi:hypothetical protein